MELIKSSALLLVLLNPFLLIVYLTDAVETFNLKSFSWVLLQGSMMAGLVFCAFGLLGDQIFSNLMQANFASFQIFGGVVFLLIGIQFVFQGPNAIQILRGDSQHLAGAIAMPILIGPGTISASVLIGQRHSPALACAAIVFAVLVSVLIMISLKHIHDVVRTKREPLIQRYIEIAGRITALFIGTISVEMIMTGLNTWINNMQAL